MDGGTANPSGDSLTVAVVDPKIIKRLLFVKLSSLGDVVHALPLLEAIREGLGPEVHIIWAVRTKFADLLQGNPHLSALSTLKGSGIGEIWGFGQTLKTERFDVALDTQGLLASGVVTRLSGAPVRIGYDLNREGNTLFLTHPVVPAKQRAHMVEKLLGFCDALGIPRLPPRPQTYLAEGERAKAGELLAGARNGPIIGCIVGASTPEKTWPQERWVAVARQLADDGCQVILLGGPSEVSIGEAITKEAGGAITANLAGKTTPRVLASVLARCDVVVGGDSGPTHLAVAVGTPVVGLYGVTDPVRTGPNWGAAPAIVLDYAEKDAPPETRRPRHPTLTDSLARIPAEAAATAALGLIGERSR